jgi:hypothetical protein
MTELPWLLARAIETCPAQPWHQRKIPVSSVRFSVPTSTYWHAINSGSWKNSFLYLFFFQTLIDIPFFKKNGFLLSFTKVTKIS